MTTKEVKFKNFDDFWVFYLSQHQNKFCRQLHFLGTVLGFFLLMVFIFRDLIEWCPAAFLVGYGFAWIGHFVFEKNIPATFRYPIWSFAADFKMAYWMIKKKNFKTTTS